MTTVPAPAVKQVTRGIRGLTLFISGLAFVVAPLLYFLPDRTDSLFAWTINPPITAAFLGGGYGTALVVEWLAARESVWARARVFFPGMLLFTSLTLIATLLHLDKFHFNAAGLGAKGTAWAWLVIYIVAPIVMLGLLLYQTRQPGGDPPRQWPLPSWFRAVLAVEAAGMLGLGAALFLVPGAAAPLWPWALTPLTAQAVGAWLLGLGFALACAIWENDWERVRLALVGNIVAGGLQLITLLRFAGALRWDTPSAWIYGSFLLGILAAGLYGVAAAHQATRLLVMAPRPS